MIELIKYDRLKIVKQTITSLETHYVFIKKLGAGGFGHVWEVMQKADTNTLFTVDSDNF